MTKVTLKSAIFVVCVALLLINIIIENEYSEKKKKEFLTHTKHIFETHAIKCLIKKCLKILNVYNLKKKETIHRTYI